MDAKEAKRRARILALMTDGFGGHGGIAQYNRDLLTALSQADSVVEIIVAPRLGQATREALPLKVRQLPPIFSKVGYSLRAIGVAVTQGPFDAVLCGHIAQVPLATVIARGIGVPLWLQLHGIDAWTRPRPIVRWGVEHAQVVTVVSRYTRRRFLAWANLQPQRVRVLPNTVGDRYAPGPKPAHLLERYGLRDKRLLLTVSRISAEEQYKGHDRVLAVMPDLLRTFPDLVYVIAGDGTGRERLEDAAREQGLRDHVKFIGRVSDADLPDLYRAADVFVMPSTGEGFGIVFLEALRSGVQVVGGNGDGSMDPLRDGTAGYAVSCDDREELVTAIRSALETPRACARHADIFNFSAFSKHCAAVMDHVLAGSRH
jgi:phosphatidylinositol alpha-1,6-mannosyltransferase